MLHVESDKVLQVRILGALVHVHNYILANLVFVLFPHLNNSNKKKKRKDKLTTPRLVYYPHTSFCSSVCSQFT